MPPSHDTALQVVTIPCLSDNYAFLILSPDGVSAALVDAPEAAPIQAELDRHGLKLSDILITHHHDDHIGAVAALAGPDTRIVGAAADAHRLPPLHLSVGDGDTFEIFGPRSASWMFPATRWVTSPSTSPPRSAVFTADSLMALGCGRLFEGTAPQMWDSLSKLAALPPETLVCSGHEYTQANARFAVTIEPDNPTSSHVRQIHRRGPRRRPRHCPLDPVRGTRHQSVPARGVAEAEGTPRYDEAEDADVFAEIRRRKDVF
jgi:hydroxyacylglutathione hydrolase